MNFNAKPVYIYRYNFNVNKNTCHWLLSTSKEERLATDQSIELASLDDLHDWIAASGEAFNGILTVQEGHCKWFEQKYVNEFGETDFEYHYILL
ncbi:hypothetical protein EDM57_21060 [Brevibacillus gelatini]|uniref:Uncharacterized protein n=1 Tax=Brevibacillus gelatini TaxID=1655277 RepID=A0A3M8ANS1_9BACL|nr:hypothetical protein [Brevibacillus gelatini]RNB52679.1 hypothetical protein EDM57_21060 [Brevibacillus gelatini]